MENESRPCPACDQPVEIESIYCSQCGTNVLLAEKAKLVKVDTEIVINDDLITNYKRLQKSISEMGNVEDIAEIQKQHFNELDRQYFALNSPIGKAKSQSQYEKRDVEELKTLTWKSLKARIKGDRDKMLSKEEQEYFKAVNEVETLVQQQEEIKKQMDVAKTQLDDAHAFVKKKEELKIEVKGLLEKIGKEIEHPIEDKLEEDAQIISKRFHEVEHQLFVLKNNQSYARNALSLYRQASKKLDGAMSMSTWDLFGGDMIADSMKRSRLGDARNLAQQGNVALNHAVKALKDESMRVSANVQDTGFWMDTFFDGIWADMNARDKIKDSQRSVEKAIWQAGEVSNKYRTLISNLNAELKAIQMEYDDTTAKLESERIKLLEAYMKKQK